LPTFRLNAPVIIRAMMTGRWWLEHSVEMSASYFRARVGNR